MSENPLVSVVVRTFNRPDRLKECLVCLQNQRYRPFEVIAVNDAGVDVETIVSNGLQGIPYQYICNPENLGRTAGLNIGVEAAAGDYVCFVDDDDGVYPNHLNLLVNTAMPDRLPVVYSDVLNVTYEKNPETQEWTRAKEQLVYSFDFEQDNFLLANYIPITCLLIRRDCFDAVGPFDESLLVYEDWEFLIRLSRKFPFQHIRAITGEYRRRDDNSNILERDRYQANEAVVKRRYRNGRDAIFDKIFKQIFQQRREIQQRAGQFDDAMKQAGRLQSQLAEAHTVIARMRQEISRLKTEQAS